MKTVLLTFVLVVNQPGNLTYHEAQKVQTIAVDKLNTLSPKVKFKTTRVLRMKDPFPTIKDGTKRLVAWNNYFNRNKKPATYIHILDAATDNRIAGIAFLCQSLERRSQVSLSMPDVERIGGLTYLTIWGIVAAHEIAHQIGFLHVRTFDKPWSIMDEFVFLFRRLRHTRLFEFVDKMDVLDQMGCQVNHVR